MQQDHWYRWTHDHFEKHVPDDLMPWLCKAIRESNAETGGYETWGFWPNWYYEWSGWGKK